MAFFLALVPACASAATGYKCTLANGNVLHAQASCYGLGAIKQEAEPRTPTELAAEQAAIDGAREAEESDASTAKLGMTAEQVREIQKRRYYCTAPRINKTTTAHGTREQWVCSGGIRYLYFDNGILTAIQD